MAGAGLFRRVLLRSPAASLFSGQSRRLSRAATAAASSAHATTAGSVAGDRSPGIAESDRQKWLTLPPFTSSIDASDLGRKIAGRRSESGGSAASAAAASTTAVKWVLRCCPQLPRSLVQKLFRLRQVRKECNEMNDVKAESSNHRLKRVTAKDLMNEGDRIRLPITVEAPPVRKIEYRFSEEELQFIDSLVLYKDSAIVVVNKPPGLPVQGGHGIRMSLDQLAASCYKHEYSEPPKLVHRLDRDCSGILVMGRTQTSSTVLHSVFHEKTADASDHETSGKRYLQKRYLALVFGSPRHAKGVIDVPLAKVLVDNGKSERITVSDNAASSQHAVTEYRVIGTSPHGLTWLELSPLTGRKHQLRVHCAEVLGTPIVGDYKYGWQAHRHWNPFPSIKTGSENIFQKGTLNLLGLNLVSGSISEKEPGLHLHCKQMVLPNISAALQQAAEDPDFDFLKLESVSLVAPLPWHMQRSWDILNSLGGENTCESTT